MWGVFNGGFPTQNTRRGRVQGDGWICPTITTIQDIYRVEKYEKKDCM